MSFSESSLEFDLFEEMRRKLTRVLTTEVRDAVEAQRIAFYVMQGVREVPRLLNALASRNATEEEIRVLLDLVLDNAASFDRARTLLAGEGEQPIH
jgi:hypothetical protein